ncbi:MAG: NACHT domain-containing protein, partial [Deltaproteobacteria bacterium]
MKKRTWLIAAFLVLIPTLFLFWLSWEVQPALPAPWNNALIILGLVVAGVLAALSGIADTLQIAERLGGRQAADRDGEEAVPQVGERGIHVGGAADVVISGDDNVVLVLQQASQKFLDTLSRPEPDLAEASRRYFQFLLTKYRNLDFRGMGVSDRLPLRLELLEMYVPLQARIERPKGETWVRDLRLAGRKPGEEEAEIIGERVSERPVLELLQKHSGLIILGDPGAGKTTFLKYLALLLALGQGEALGLGPRLPVLLPLSDYANQLSNGNVPLDTYIETYYRQAVSDNGEFPVAKLLQTALAQGRALILLDGLDEVRQEHLRRTVVDRVEDFFALQKQRGNKFVLTSRLVGYKEVRPAADDLQECTLMDFGEEEIAQFTRQWTRAVARAAHGQTKQAAFDAAQEEADLLAAIHKNPGVHRLAANPLMLTILAVMKRQDVVLPERRVELYEQYVKTMLKHWNLARGLGKRQAHDLDVVETVRVLAPLALWMHETSPGKGLVKEGAMRRQLTQIYRDRGVADPEPVARQLLEDTHKETAMLLERGMGQYGFIHLTFQEYLAAVGIAQKGQLGIEPVVQSLAARIDDPNWHEVIQLTIGYLGIVQGYETAASQVVQSLLAQKPGEAGQVEVLMGMTACDVGEHGLTPACRQAVVDALLAAIVDDERVTAAQRAAAGDTLARLGDPRPEVMDVDAMRFCYVPPGPF